MKTAIILVLAACMACSPKLQQTSATCFKGKLVKRGICGQRVVQLLSGPVDAVVMARQWTDSLSGKQYENVFTVGNLCDFPATIQEGQEFSFSITTTPGSNCATCFAYTPTPVEKNNIVTGCSE
ncbi:hypothetical protein GWC95_08835 [Sediminibacterium roseum]|uniref:Uncharacterized protein n=1 Tax=Sediminibacterium roseum TaxID=1978412 RepID=A0ABW9ZU75_9BACT|nr:hypothetical protein [Sediminibacterium roseum]NCI50025.1 hypothetical protein [Sediminibacterium roseum]